MLLITILTEHSTCYMRIYAQGTLIDDGMSDTEQDSALCHQERGLGSLGAVSVDFEATCCLSFMSPTHGSSHEQLAECRRTRADAMVPRGLLHDCHRTITSPEPCTSASS